jgi:phosphoribosylglycinamide formyltransferase-1
MKVDKKMLNIAVMASTNATDSQAIIDAIKSGELEGVNFRVMICSKGGCGAMERAKREGIKAVFVDPKKYPDREAYDKEISKVIENGNVELILLIGYAKILSPWFIGKYKNRIMNIHPSLLPAFPAAFDRNIHQDVLDYGCKVSGCSLIFIDEGVDTGPVIMQEAVRVGEGETVETLRDKIQAAEKRVIVEAIKKYRDGRISVEGRIVHVRD